MMLIPVPGLRPGLLPSYACSLSHFVRLQLSSRLPILLLLLRSPSFQARKLTRYGDSSNFQLVRCRKRPTMLLCTDSYQFAAASELWQARSTLTTSHWLTYQLHNKGIASVSKSQDETSAASSCDSNSYRTLTEPHTHTLEVKRSKFIAAAAPVDDEAAALSFLAQVRDTSASHNCWAFKIGDRSRFSDDGEPGGTAGRPMLSAITSSGLDHVVVVVTRFFGGTKLGTGGLVRAYGKVTTECLKDASTITIKAKASLKLRATYDALGVLYPLLQTYGVEKVDENFDTEGEGGVTMDLLVDVGNLQLLERELEVTCKGRASVSQVAPCS